MSKYGWFVMVLTTGLILSTGCSKSSVESPAPAESPAETTLDEGSPAEVTEQFFAAFFSGEDAKAFALLTPKAQEATRNSFSAEASDTIKWTVGETESNADTATVRVRVEDLNEEGSVSAEQLTFTLRSCDRQWRVAGFATEGLMIDFEAQEITSSAPVEPDSVATESAGTNSGPASSEVRVGQLPEAPVFR